MRVDWYQEPAGAPLPFHLSYKEPDLTTEKQTVCDLG
jgi:hypothetical protein